MRSELLRLLDAVDLFAQETFDPQTSLGEYKESRVVLCYHANAVREKLEATEKGEEAQAQGLQPKSKEQIDAEVFGGSD